VGGQSLLAIAFDRLNGIVPDDNRWVCTGESHREAVLATLDDLDTEHVLGEPCARDTVNAVGFTAAVLLANDPDAIFAVLTADHLITPVEQFAACLDHGFALVEEDASRMVTFGITPTHAATGYGYVELGDAVNDHAATVKRFVEKPDAETAASYIAAGRFKWNSGMFIFSARGFLDALARYQPEAAAGLQRIGVAWNSDNGLDVLQMEYPTLPKISVDYAVMEPAGADPAVNVCCVPMDVEWLDVGSWEAAAETVEPDDDGNRSNGVALHLNSTNTFVHSDDPDHLIATIGCEDLIIVKAGDVTLVCPRSASQQVKSLVDLLPDERR
jgi:mannose-1-phosphate guanylyltransferase